MNFKLEIVLILSLLSDISLQFKDSFCDPKHKNSLIDTVFNSETTIYAIRKSRVYPIVKKDKMWTQMTEAIQLNQFFKGFDISSKSFQSGFSIQSVTGCKKCNLSQMSVNLTYMFSDDQFYVFEELSNFGGYLFVNSTDARIPWKTNNKSYGINTGNTKEFFGITGNINSAFFNWNSTQQKAFGYLLASNGSLFRTEITDILDSNRDKPLLESIMTIKNLNPKSFGGSFTRGFAVNFVVKDYLYPHVIDKTVPIDTSHNSKHLIWDYFECEDMETETEANSVSSIVSDSESEFSTESPTEESEEISTIDTTISESNFSTHALETEKTDISIITTIEENILSEDPNETLTLRPTYETTTKSAKQKNLIITLILVFFAILTVGFVLVYYFMAIKRMRSRTLPDRTPSDEHLSHREGSQQLLSAEPQSLPEESPQKQVPEEETKSLRSEL